MSRTKYSDEKMSKIGVVIYYDERAKYGLNALVASIDLLKEVNAYLVEDRESICGAIDYASKKYDKCVVAFSVLTTFLADESYLDFARSVSEHARRRGCIPIVGGPHATGDPMGSLESLGFEHAFVGEAEESLREFLEALNSGGDPLSVRGVVSIVNGEVHFAGPRKPINLDEYHPFPYWRLLFNPIEISRGCPHGCKYCQVPYMHGLSMRHRSIDRVVHYSKVLAASGIRDLRFISPNSLAYCSREAGRPDHSSLESLLSKLHEEVAIKRGARIFFGTFPSEVRPDYVDEDVLKVLGKYVYNRDIIIGAQSGSDRLLKLINRGHSVDDVLSAVELARKHGFRALVDFIFGLPRETEEDLRDTLSTIKRLVSLGARVHLHYFIPLPGTPLSHERPREVPQWFKREVAKLIGAGKAYGEWARQEELSRKILELRERGIIRSPALVER